MRTASISTHCFKKSTWISKMPCFPSDKQSLYCPLCTVNKLHLAPLYCPNKMSFGEVDSLMEVNVLNCNFFRPRTNSDGQVVSNQQKIVIYNQSQELIFIWTVFHMYVVDEQIHCNLFQHNNSLTRKQSSKEYPADAQQTDHVLLCCDITLTSCFGLSFMSLVNIPFWTTYTWSLL